MKIERILGVPSKMQLELEEKYNLAEKGIPAQESKREIRLLNDSDFDSERKDDTKMLKWVFSKIPKNLQNNDKVKTIFKNVSLRKDFRSVWNCGVYIPKKLIKKSLIISYSSKKIGYLGHLSNIYFDSEKIAASENIADEIDIIEEEIKRLNGINGIPFEEICDNNTPRRDFNTDVYLYLIRMVVIKKLEEILKILKQYELKESS